MPSTSPLLALAPGSLRNEKSRQEAMRCLKRRISDALYRQLRADANDASSQSLEAFSKITL